MSIYFSEKFKQLRKNHELTQEEIADIFHVSPKCVSRWETGTNYPDVELLPHIAIFFKVTLDELLGTEEIKDGKKVDEYSRDIRNLLNSGKLYDAIDMAHKAIKEYPVAGNGLHYLLTQALCTACSEETPGYKENTEKYKNEIIKIGERIINNEPNASGNKIDLIRLYVKWGMKEDAKRILDTMPGEIWDAKEVWEGCVLEGDEWRKHQQVTIVRTHVLFSHLINEYLDKIDLDPLQKIEYEKIGWQSYNLIKPIVSEADSCFHDDPDVESYLDSAFGNIGTAKLYCEAGDIENALNCVEKATQDSMHHIDRMDTTNADGSNYFVWSTPRNLPWVLWEDHLMKPQFDIIRTNERFIKCFELLKANSRELK